MSPLETLEQKLQIVRDRVVGIAERLHSALFIWGSGGTSKSFTVEQTLKASGRSYRLTTARLTAKGLFELLRDYPDEVHVLEDCEPILKDKNAAGVLRAALWGQVNEKGVRERIVSWVIGGRRQEVIFTGGIIMIANVPIDNLPELLALQTRVCPLHYEATSEELAALMRKICEFGHRHGELTLTPAECVEVAEEIIGRCTRTERALDLRLLIHAFQDRLQWTIGASESHWIELLESRMRQRVCSGGGAWQEMKDREYEVLRSLGGLSYAEKLAKWIEITKKSKAAMDRRGRELKKQLGCQDGEESDTTTPPPIEPFGLRRVSDD
jgi:hypothetical protein